MSKAIQNAANSLPAEISDIVSGIANVQNATRSDGSGDRGAFMKFTKGKYLYGSDNLEPEEDSLWAVNPTSFRHGFHAWGNGQLLGDEVVGMNEAPVNKSTLQVRDYVDSKTKREEIASWDPYRGLELACTNGEDKGTACILGGTSVGMVRAINGLLEELGAHLAEDASTPVPIIELGVDSYMHTNKTYGEIFIPVFTVVEWLSMDATIAATEEDEDEAEEPEVEPEPEKEEKPARKRRQRRTAS